MSVTPGCSTVPCDPILECTFVTKIMTIVLIITSKTERVLNRSVWVRPKGAKGGAVLKHDL